MAFKKKTDKAADKPAETNEKPAAKAGAESTRERFLRLAPPRTEAALKKISLLGNLAGAAYEFEPAEVEQMIGALSEAVDEVKSKFDKKVKGKRKGFTFVRNRPRAVA